MKTIKIIGCGPGHPDYLTGAAIAAVNNADLLIGAEHLLDLFPDICCRRIKVSGTMTDVLDQVNVLDMKNVCVLVSGDPGLFSLARLFANRFGRDKCQILPGISSLQLACARLALDWSDLLVFSAHGRTPTVSSSLLRQTEKMALLAGDNKAKQWLADQWEQVGDGHHVVSCENLSLDTEVIRTFGNVVKLREAVFPSRTIFFFLKDGVER